MKTNQTVMFTMYMPETLRKRLRTAAKSMGVAMSHFTITAIMEKLDLLEAKERAAKERERAEKEARFAARRISSSLSPKAKVVAQQEKNDEVDQIYRDEAEKIARAYQSGSAIEKRLATLEAVATIKRNFPITHPSDEEIISILEKLVLVLLRDAPPVQEKLVLSNPQPTKEPLSKPLRVVDDLVGKLIPKQIRTFGDVNLEEETEDEQA